MADAKMLFKDNEGDKIRYAVTLVLYNDGEVQLSPETEIDGKSYFLDINEAYRVVCDIKNQLEIMRNELYRKDFINDFLNSLDDEEDE